MRQTASRAALLGSCQYWARVGVPWDESTGRSAKMGDEYHKAIAPVVDATLATPPFPPTTKWFRERFAHGVAWVDANGVPGMRAEAAYAYDPEADTARLLGYDIGRKYEEHGKLAHEIAGSADIVWLDGDTVHVRDWKTGRSVTDAVWPQLEWLGLFAVRATPGARIAVAGALHVTDYGVGGPAPRMFGEADLKTIANEIRERSAMVADAWPEPSENCDGCYCPARPACDLYQLRKKVA